MSECADLTYYHRNRDVILNRAKVYYENDKKRLRRPARDKCRRKKLKRENIGKKRYRNMSDEKKQRLKEYQKFYREGKCLNIIKNKIIF